LTGEFETHQCAQAVTEEGKRFVEEWGQGFGERLDKGRELRERGLQ
jgi:hypothetical protein